MGRTRMRKGTLKDLTRHRSALQPAKAAQTQQNATLTMPNQKPHDILGVPEDATASQVRKAYLRLALKKHPDKGGDVDEFRKLQEAYEQLRDGSGGVEEAKERRMFHRQSGRHMCHTLSCCIETCY